jgi:CRISPR-associated endonuclease/helicase Cas3
MYFAHTPSIYKPEEWHALSDHSLQVAEACKEIGKKLGFPNTAYTLGILHDLGKLKPEFQKKLVDAFYHGINHVVPHKEVGAYLIQQSNPLLSLVLLGHHYQIPSYKNLIDALEKTNDTESSQCKQKLKEMLPEFEMNILDFDPGTKPIEVYLRIKMANSVLVDSDHEDTSKFYNKYPYKINKININNLEKIFLDYYESFISEDNEINSQRKQLFQDCLDAAETSHNFYVLPAPTGAGKTLSSLAFGLKKALLYNKDRVIFALPFTSIIEQTSAIYEDIYKDIKNSVLEHHSSVIDSDDKSKNIWRSKTSENWNSPIVVTTTVQLFESLFSNKPSKNKKLHNIANSVIVLDEAQLLPIIYMKPIMECLKTLSEKYNCTIVICTATPPFLNNNKSWALNEPPYCIVKNVSKMFDVFKRVNFIYEKNQYKIQDFIEEITSYEQVLCIVNKRKTAQKLIKSIDKKNTYHLSTTMTPKHRSEVVNTIKQRLKQNLPVTVIATSCVECGVDFDFPQVYREIAPLPSIVQAAGRCNRNGKQISGNVYIFSLKNENVHDPILKTGIEITKSLLNKNIFDLENIEHSEFYFKELYKIYDSQLDKKKILDEIKYLNFENVNDKFTIIEQDTISLVISNQESSEIISSILNGLITGREINRKLAPFTLSVYKTDIANMTVDTNTLPDINIWAGSYDSLLGIELDIDNNSK